ncbi:MAG TPA: alkaline phosphatase family protein [Gammaproteobacteria bacterium]|nr:alkaline phosphatase family protein [Gammaproteobacteria bacterium]
MSLLSPFKALLKLYFIFIAIFTIGRIVLFILYWDRIQQSGVAYGWSFLYGLKMDTMVASFLLLPPALILHFTPRIAAGFSSFILRVYLLFVIVLAIYMENATLPFFAEFDVRPNAIFLNYLEYPKEVLGNIWASYKLELLIGFSMMGLLGFLFWRWSATRYQAVMQLAWWKRALLFFPVFLLLFIGGRASFGHRPANLSDAVYSPSHLVNEITKNTVYAVGYAAYSQKQFGANVAAYGKMPIQEALNRVSQRLNIPLNKGKIPFLRMEKTHFPAAKPKNLVLLVEESLGAQFVAATGGEPGITPEFNRLASEGILFRQLFSNGTRSVRGLAGVVAGFLPVPGQGVLKRNKAQKDFFTIAQLLKPLGYHSSFIYGGEKRFDNMGGWFYGNGFDQIIDEPQFEHPDFHGIWGVSDEDLVRRAHQEYEKLAAQGTPFVSVMFSTTNHTPFEFPENRITLVPGVPVNSVKNAVKFADYAIGQFIQKAKQSSYWDNTVFVIVADHNVRVYGDDLLPVNMFHIPALILGGGIEPAMIDQLSTQPDVLATALDLIGVDLTHPVLGRSVFSAPAKDNVFLQFHDMYGLRVKDQVVVLQPDTKPEYFTYVNEHLKPGQAQPELAKDLLAFILVSSHLYEKRLHTLQAGKLDFQQKPKAGFLQ